MKLADYVLKRNGVPLGASRSMRNMLSRSFGAGKFSEFWKYWNPIWSFYLGSYIFKPLKKILPASLALLVTFIVSGFIHDVAIMLVKWKPIFLFTPWFTIMGLIVLTTEFVKLNYSKFHFSIRALINLLIIVFSYLIANQIRI